MNTVLSVSESFSPSHLSCFYRPLKEWIDSNTLYQQQGFVWNIGIADAENILAVENTIRQDMTCKHFKSWRTGSFKEAMDTIRDASKLPTVFKSPKNSYTTKGIYIFAYKTVMQKNSRLYHTLRF